MYKRFVLRRFFTLLNRGNAVTPNEGEEELSNAEMYLYGAGGLRRDTAEASKWLWKSFSKGNDKAALLLADLYLKGDGVPKNCDQAIDLLYGAARKGVSGAEERLRNLRVLGYRVPVRPGNSLFSFIDLKDPFAPSEIAGEYVLGPILSLMNARQFEHVFLFHTPHTRTNAIATEQEISRRYPECRIRLQELPVLDPKNYSRVVERLALAVVKLDRHGLKSTTYVCVSSGTTEMRASWFILTALAILQARLLRVDTPPCGPAKVTDTGDFWSVSPSILNVIGQYLRDKPTQVQAASAGQKPEFTQVFGTEAAPPLDTQPPQDELALGFESDEGDPGFYRRRVPGLDEKLQELGIHVGSAVLRNAATRAGVAACSPLPVLLLGETGVGKECFAHLIHRLSPRSKQEMVAINCAAIPKELAESYFFGHTRGAFSGAVMNTKGVFDDADQSTLFLDEVAELPLEIQAKLLRVIQDGSFRRVGSREQLRVNVRVVAATNRDLAKEVAAGRFREDLYFRLEVVQIKLPSLRERRAEIPELALFILRQINQRRHKPCQLSKEALARLEHYHWPGNVRELHNVLERSVLYSPKERLEAEHVQIEDNKRSIVNLFDLPEPIEGFSLEDYLNDVREELIRRALKTSGGNQAEAGRSLGISRQAINKFLAERSDNPS